MTKLKKRSTTAPITNYFSVIPVTKSSKAKVKQPEVIISKPLQEKPVKPHPSISEDVAQRKKKRDRRRAARAQARSQMEANIIKTEYENRRDNLNIVCSKVYSLSIERRKRRRAVKQRKSKEKKLICTTDRLLNQSTSAIHQVISQDIPDLSNNLPIFYHQSHFIKP